MKIHWTRVDRQLLTRLCLALLFACATSVQAQNSNANPRAFGLGKPDRLEDLPASQFRRDVLSLPTHARAKALKSLKQLSVPAEDVKYLRVSKYGELWYADTFLPDPAAAAAVDDPVVGEAIAESEIFKLHSKPGSANVLFLDFDGHVITGTRWNNHPTYGTGIDPHPALPFDPSTNDSPATVANFTSDELNRIGEIWHRMAEDFAPFDIDVTTEEPTTFTNTTGHVLFTHDTDANGNAMPSQGAGGVAWINVFGGSSYVSLYSPALVYYTNLYTNSHGFPTLNAEAGSHEFGHNIGLGHDGGPGTSYYSGHGSGLVSWGPIMGGSYSDNVTQWSNGHYTGATNFEDDVAIITGDLGLDTDDHGDDWSSATEVVVQPGTGDILVSNPEIDPHNAMGENKGVIHSSSDVDWWYLDVGAGAMTLVVTPAWHAFTRSSHRGANLDVEITLYDSSLTQVAYSEPTNDTYATTSITASAGRYYLKIDGVANGTAPDYLDGYPDYNSMGMYFIEGTSVPASADGTPPTPNPMTWASPPASGGPSSIDMTASLASDPSGPVEYNFICVSGGNGCDDSGWGTSSSYSDTGLDAGTQYSYLVRARDAVGNTTGDSSTENATTDPPPPNAPTGFTATAVSQSQINLAWTDASSDEDGFNLRRSTDQAIWTNLGPLAANSTSFNDDNGGAGLAAGTQYFYELRAFSNTNGSSAWVAANDTTLEDPPNGTPTGLAATSVGTSQIDLAWTDVATNASSFKVERSADGTTGWSEIASVSPGTQAYSDTGLASGATWYYRVGAFTTGGIFYSNVDSATTDFECTVGPVTIPNTTWQKFALPCTPASNSVGAIVGQPLNTYGTEWLVLWYDNAAGGGTPDYVPLQFTDPMYEGRGYYIYTSTPISSWNFGGANNTGADIDLRTDATNGAWNLVGNPHNGTVAWPDVLVIKSDGTPVSIANADKKRGNNPHDCDQTPPHSQCLLSRIMYKWNGTVNEAYDGAAPMEGVLNAFDVIWVKAFKSGIKLRVPAPSPAPPAEETLAEAPSDKSNKKGGGNGKKGGGNNGGGGGQQPWHVQLIAESGVHSDPANYLGQQNGTRDGQDRRDLEEPGPFGGKYLSLLFANPDFDQVAWGHTSDFRELGATRTGDWDFVVRASAHFSEVTLRWVADDATLANATLFDEQTGLTIAVEPGGSYTFTMDGDENRFRLSLR